MNKRKKSFGYALVTALIFLLILTMVAITAIRSTGLELKMGANTVLRTEAFESSESPRLLLGSLIEAHVFSRGWPALIGGDVPNNLFDFDIPTGLSFYANDGTTPTTLVKPPRDWYSANIEKTATPNGFGTAYIFSPKQLKADAAYSRNLVSGSPSHWVRSSLAVYKLRTDINPGAGAAFGAGYEGIGKAAAAAGANIFFYTQSAGTQTCSESSVTNCPQSESGFNTAAVFRNVVRN